MVNKTNLSSQTFEHEKDYICRSDAGDALCNSVSWALETITSARYNWNIVESGVKQHNP
jgi:hypothetical protein